MSFLMELIKARWNPPRDTHPSFQGRNVIVTGANTGVGFEAAVKFIQLGAQKVILGVRTLSKGEEARQQIEARTSRKDVVQVWELDMLDYASIKDFAKRCVDELDHLDIAVLNAGIAAISYRPSAYGWEQTLQVNVLSTALLALLLLPKLRASRTEKYTPVLEIVGSGSHRWIKNFTNESAPLAGYNTTDDYTGQIQYPASKLFVMYAQQAIIQLVGKEAEGAEAHVVVICPGPTRSNLTRDAASRWYFRPLVSLFRLVQRPTEVGARTYVSGVDKAAEKHGKFWMDDAIQEPMPLLVGEKGERFQKRVWEEIVEALQKDVPEVKQLASA